MKIQLKSDVWSNFVNFYDSIDHVIPTEKNCRFASSGTGGGAKGSGAKKGLMPNRTTPRGGSRGRGGRGSTRGRGATRGGNTGRIQKRAAGGQMQSHSQQAAKKRLLQAKKTLQLAIQVCHLTFIFFFSFFCIFFFVSFFSIFFYIFFFVSFFYLFIFSFFVSFFLFSHFLFFLSFCFYFLFLLFFPKVSFKIYYTLP